MICELKYEGGDFNYYEDGKLMGKSFEFNYRVLLCLGSGVFLKGSSKNDRTDKKLSVQNGGLQSIPCSSSLPMIGIVEVEEKIEDLTAVVNTIGGSVLLVNKNSGNSYQIEDKDICSSRNFISSGGVDIEKQIRNTIHDATKIKPNIIEFEFDVLEVVNKILKDHVIEWKYKMCSIVERMGVNEVSII